MNSLVRRCCSAENNYIDTELSVSAEKLWLHYTRGTASQQRYQQGGNVSDFVIPTVTPRFPSYSSISLPMSTSHHPFPLFVHFLFPTFSQSPTSFPHTSSLPAFIISQIQPPQCTQTANRQLPVSIASLAPLTIHLTFCLAEFLFVSVRNILEFWPDVFNTTNSQAELWTLEKKNLSGTFFIFSV